MKPLVISLCDLTGNAVQPWLEAGYECWIIDLWHPEGQGEVVNGLCKIGADVSKWQLPKDRQIAFVTAFPPCTHLAVTGARWFKGKGLDALAEGIRLVSSCNKICLESNAPYYLENPVSTLSTYWREPDHTYDPCDYAGYLSEMNDEAYTKRTCLWVGGGFIMPKPKRLPPVLGSKMHMLLPSDDRANMRAVTPKGFSKAVYESNAQRVKDLLARNYK